MESYDLLGISPTPPPPLYPPLNATTHKSEQHPRNENTITIVKNATVESPLSILTLHLADNPMVLGHFPDAYSAVGRVGVRANKAIIVGSYSGYYPWIPTLNNAGELLFMRKNKDTKKAFI